MLGKQVKSGVRQIAEQTIIEHTDGYGYIPIRAVQSVRNQSIIKQVLKEWGYEAVLTKVYAIKGYQSKVVGKQTHEETVDQKIKNLIDESLVKNGRVLFSQHGLLKDNKKLLTKASILLSDKWHERGKTIVPIYKPLKDGRQQMIGFKLEH